MTFRFNKWELTDEAKAALDLMIQKASATPRSLIEVLGYGGWPLFRPFVRSAEEGLPPPESTTPIREENTGGLRAAAIRARKSSRKASSSASAAVLRGLVMPMAIVRQSLTQLQPKTYPQWCCPKWDKSVMFPGPH